MNRCSGWMKTLALTVLCGLLAAGCAAEAGFERGPAGSDAAAPEPSVGVPALYEPDAAALAGFDEHDEMTSWDPSGATRIALNGEGAEVSGAGAFAEGGVVTIAEAGEYVVAGTLANGGIVVEAGRDGIVHLVLGGVQIANSAGPAIHVKKADKVILTLQDETDNMLMDGEPYADTSADAPTAAVFSMGGLTINGGGSLHVFGNAAGGIASRDRLVIAGGLIRVQAADDGIVGRDLAAVKGGHVVVSAGGDGIKSTNDEDGGRGNIAIAGGKIAITSGGDGMQAAADLAMVGGELEIVAGGGSAAGAPGDDEASAKGLKAARNLFISGGAIRIDAADDALHSDGGLFISGGAFTLATGDDAIHADSVVHITDGSIDIAASYEGIEATDITVSGGTIRVVSRDDGINIAGSGDDAAASSAVRNRNGAPGGTLTISGGYIVVDASGDGLDANGSIVMTGGTVIVNGPTDEGNAALDYDRTFRISGGVLAAAGSARMAQAPSDDSEQASVFIMFRNTMEAGTLVSLHDSGGNTVFAFAPSKPFRTLVVSAPNLKEGETYTIMAGGSHDGAAMDGLYEDGTATGGMPVASFRMDGRTTHAGGTGAQGGRFGGREGGRP